MSLPAVAQDAPTNPFFNVTSLFSLRDRGIQEAFLGTTYRGWNSAATPRSPQACIPGTWLEVLNWLLLLCASIVVIHSTIEYARVKDTDDPDLRDEKRRIIGAALSAAAVFIWPVVWDAIIGYALLTRVPFTLLGFAWPMLLTLIDLTYSVNSGSHVSTQRAFGLATISTDTSTILSLTFSVALLLTSLGTSDKTKASVSLLFYGLLILAALILPVPALNPDSSAGFAVSTLQRIAINYTVGIILASLALNISPDSGQSLRDLFLPCTDSPPPSPSPAKSNTSSSNNNAAPGVPAPMATTTNTSGTTTGGNATCIAGTCSRQQ